MSFVGAGKKGRDVRAHFSNPPYGWPQDAVDAALISLFGSGHLRAKTDGVYLKTNRLNQSNIPKTDFRVETTVINAHQRIKIRKLFIEAGVSCKPNEESATAVEFLNKLNDLASAAGGDAPLPEGPDTNHILDLKSLTDNEQLLSIFEQYDKLLRNINDWTKASELAKVRLPAYKRLQSLVHHADELDIADEVRPQVDAIASNRRLLDCTDSVPEISKALVDALRAALVKSEKCHADVFDREYARIESAESWQKIEQSDRRRILSELKITKNTKGVTGTEQDVLESLERISLDAWQTRTNALPQMFTEARIRAERLIEPKVRKIGLDAVTLHTPKEVKDWIAKTELELLEQIEQGPIMVS